MNIYKVIVWTDWDGNDYPVNKGSVAADLAVIECVRKNGYAFGGDSHQNEKGCCPVLERALMYPPLRTRNRRLYRWGSK